MKKVIVFTGGGTAGHVTPNLALIEALNPAEWDIHYVGSEGGVEQTLVAAIAIPYHAIKTGKLRRYFSWRTLFEPFFILWGMVQSFFLLRRLKADVVFSKGGFVAFPVVVGAWLNRIPVIAHESDLSPGLANRLCFPFVRTICVTFDAGKKYFKNPHKVIVTGTPIRRALFAGDKIKGLALCGFHDDKPCLLVIGGSQGAHRINQVVREILPQLLPKYQVIHLCGQGKLDSTLVDMPGYCQLEYANETLADLFAASDLVISRAGANSVYEILALHKPVIFIPLSLKMSRGDQLQNARHFEKQQIGHVIEEEALTQDVLLAAVDKVHKHSAEMIAVIRSLQIVSGTDSIIELVRLAVLK